MPGPRGDRFLTRAEIYEQRYVLNIQLARAAVAWTQAWNSPALRFLNAAQRDEATKGLANTYRTLLEQHRRVDM